MVWLITIPLAIVAAYAVLGLMIDTGAYSDSRTPYWILLVASVALIWIAWFHPIRITFA